MREQPKAPSEVAPDVPRDLERVILRCLRKEADRRYQSMADVRLELEQIKEDSDSQQQAGASLGRGRWYRRPVAAAVAAVLLLAAGAWAVLRPGKAAPPSPQLVPLTTLEGYEWSPSFSPDGEQVAFSRHGDWEDASIYVKMVGSAEVRRLTTDPAADGPPAGPRTAGRSPSSGVRGHRMARLARG